MEIKEYTKAEAQRHILSMGKNKMVFFCNVFGWTLTYSLEPTWMTPTGRDPLFPRRVTIYLSGWGPLGSDDIKPVKEKGTTQS